MKNLFKLLGFIALVAVIGFSFAACGGGDDSDGGGGALVGKWYETQEEADTVHPIVDPYKYWFKDGKVSFGVGKGN